MLVDSSNFQWRIVPARWDLKQVPPKLDIKQKSPEVKLDFSQSWASIGYKDLSEFQKSFSGEALETSQNGISRRVQEGETLKKIEKNIGFPDIARQREVHAIGRPVLAYIEPVDVEVKIRPIEFTVQMGQIKMAYSPGYIQSSASTLDVNA